MSDEIREYSDLETQLEGQYIYIEARAGTQTQLIWGNYVGMDRFAGRDVMVLNKMTYFNNAGISFHVKTEHETKRSEFKTGFVFLDDVITVGMDKKPENK